MAQRVVLAYSGGLDTSVAVRWMIENLGVEVDLPLGRRRPGGHPRRQPGEGARRRRDRLRGARPARGVRPRLPRADHQGERALRGPVPARVGAVAAADRPAAGGHGTQVRGGRHRPRLHRQGQRPGALRGLVDGAGPGPRTGRTGAQLGLHPRGLDRLRRRARDPGRGHQGEALLDRRQPLGPCHRVRRDGGPVGRAARGCLADDPSHRDRAARADDRVRAGRARVARRRATAAARADHLGQPHRRRLRLGSARHGREPPGRHQEPRDLRGAGRAGADDGARGPGVDHPRA